MNEDERLLEQARLIVQRLERISADSTWARRSSGHRGALLRYLERWEAMEGEIDLLPEERARLTDLLETGFVYLQKAALERLR